jgi:predicted acylesterase/phospholipase RssA
LKVIDGLEMTYRIPILFVPIIYQNNYIVEGGITNNFPINQVEDKESMLGVYVRGNNVIRNFNSFVLSIVDTFINLQPNNHRNNNNCFDIDLYNISIYSDQIDNQTIDFMINEGYQQTKKFFS